jgi:hypothetical protein
MSSGRESALRRLTEMDAQLQTTIPIPLSMHPARTRATSLHDIGEALLTDDLDPSLMQAFADGLCLMVVTKLDQFPDNIFWDVDYLAACLLRLGDAHAIRDVTAHIVTLHEGFGRSSVINFRYVHDFMYGFDWARWVSHEPETRQGIGPFDKTYLYHVEERRGELVECIADHDAQFGLAADGVHHNPFRFSREPADERRLHEALAGDNLIPVQAWRFDGTRDWARPYTQIREQYAQKLGIPVRPRGRSLREVERVRKLMS